MFKNFTKKLLISVFVLAFVFSGSFSNLAQAVSTTATNPGTGANVAGIGTVGWTNASNITTVGSPYAAFVDADTGQTSSNYLQGTNYGFSIPSGSTINGISVTINRQGTQAASYAGTYDNVISLIKGGSVTGDNKASAFQCGAYGSPTADTSVTYCPEGSTSHRWPTTFGTRSYGGAEDLWGTSWTAEDINASNFGVALSAKTSANNSSSKTADVDYMQITVYYTVPVAPTVVSVSPVNGATSVNRSSPIVITFDQPMDTESFDFSTDQSTVWGTPVWSSGDTVVTIPATTTLYTSRWYIATISTNTESAEALALAEPYEWTFRTAGSSNSNNQQESNTEPEPVVEETETTSTETDTNTNAETTTQEENVPTNEEQSVVGCENGNTYSVINGEKCPENSTLTPPVTNPYDFGPANLRLRSRGDGVRELQRFFNEIENNPLIRDGVFGKNTDSAVRSYQKANGLRVDGVVGAITRASMYTKARQ